MAEEKKQKVEKKQKTEQKTVKEVKKQEKEEKNEKVVQGKKNQEKETSLSQKSKDIIDALEKMTLIEVSQLVKALEEKFGVSAAAPVVSAPAAVVGSNESAEEKSAFEVVLTNVGSNKIQVIKEVRAITTLGLKEAKDLVEQAPKTVKKDVSKEEAGEIKKKMEAIGAKVEIK